MSITAPYDARALDGLSQTLETTARLYATTAAGDFLLELDTESIVLTEDEGWTPHARLESTCVSPEALHLLDPRTGVRLVLELGYIYAGGDVDQHTRADLVLREWTQSTPGGTVNLQAHSDETLLLEWVQTAGTRTYPVGAQVVDVITAEISATLGRPVTVTAVRDSPLAEPVTIGPGTSLWDVLKSLADSADVWLYCDALRQWRIADRPRAVGASVVQVTTGAVGNTTGIESGRTRDGWGNVVELEYDGDRFAYASQTTGPMAVSVVGVCAVRVKLNAPWPGTGPATAAARSILSRTLTRGDNQALTALAAWWLRVGNTLTTPTQARVIAATVRFTYPDSLMTVTTRTPEAI